MSIEFSAPTQSLVFNAATTVSDLPTATAEDVGKILSVQTVYHKGTVIVPEQTGDGDRELSNVNQDLLVEGTTVIATINGTEYVKTVDAVGTVDGEEYAGWSFYIEGENYMFYAEDIGIYTVSLHVGVPAYEWQPDPYNGADMVIKLNKGLNFVTATEAKIVKGSYDLLKAKAVKGLPIHVTVYGVDMSNGAVSRVTELVSTANYDTHKNPQDTDPDPKFRIYAFRLNSIMNVNISGTVYKLLGADNHTDNFMVELVLHSSGEIDIQEPF